MPASVITLGLLTNLVGGGYHGEVIAAIARTAAAVGARLIVVQTLSAGLAADARSDPGAPFLKEPTAHARVDGWLLMPLTAHADALEALAARGVPMVGISTPIPGGSMVLPDNTAGAQLAVEHLLAHGHTAIAFVGCLRQNDIRARYDAYTAAMGAAGLTTLLYEATDNLESGGRIAAGLLLADGVPSTAVLAATDLNALAVSAVLTEHGMVLPADQAVVGFDDIERAGRSEPPLTTVRISHQTLAAEATVLLLDLIGGAPERAVAHQVGAELIVRESCGCGPAPTSYDPGPLTTSSRDTLLRAVAEALVPPDAVPLDEAGSRALHDLVDAIADLIDSSGKPGSAETEVVLADLVRALFALHPDRSGFVGVVCALKRYADTVLDAAGGDHGLTSRLFDTVVVAAAAVSEMQTRTTIAAGDSLKSALYEQYEVVLNLLRSVDEDPRQLLWVRGTDIRSACLGLWSGQSQPRSLHIPSVVGATVPIDAVVGSVVTVDRFPPQEFLDDMRSERGEVLFVLPVLVNSSDWGLFALTTVIDGGARLPRETFNYWTALLAVALDQRALLGSLRERGAALAESYHRERDLAAEIRQREVRYALASAAASDGLWDWDVVKGSLFWSPRLRAILGFDEVAHDSSVHDWFALVHGDDRAHLRAQLDRRRVESPARMEHEYRMIRADGSVIWVLVRAIDVRDGDDVVIRIVGSLTDVTERKVLEEQLRQGALYDAITGLPNRTLFVSQLETAVAQARRSPESEFVVLFLDLDGFKVVNDSLGHTIGDLLLKEVGARLRMVLRDGDTGARLGGDEFAVLLAGVRLADVQPVVARLQEALLAPFDIDGHHVVVSASVGVAGGGGGVQDPQAAEDIIRDADIAMYRAKSTERGTFAVFDVAMHERAVSRLRTEVQLRNAIAVGGLEVHYQPVVDLDSGAVRRLEALLRWRHPDRGLLLPGDFLAVAEESGLLIPIGRWLLNESCRELAQWRAAGLCSDDLSVSVNVSHREFWHGGLVDSVPAALATAGLPAGALTLEITEGVIMDQPDQALRALIQLRDAGVLLHVDDFGTGYSSLQSLHRFPIHALKIDQSFVADITTDPRSLELIRIIVLMAANLDVAVIAEGIESLEQRDALVALGCVEGQGFWYSAALPGDEVCVLLDKRLPVAGAPEPRLADAHGVSSP